MKLTTEYIERFVYCIDGTVLWCSESRNKPRPISKDFLSVTEICKEIQVQKTAKHRVSVILPQFSLARDSTSGCIFMFGALSRSLLQAGFHYLSPP